MPRIAAPHFVSGLALALLASGPFTAPASAKEYNQSGQVPSDAQALINRIQADIAHRGADEGFYGSFEDDCGSLNIGANSDGSAPDQQVIVADKIINIGGRCRVVRSQGGFMRDAGTPPEDTLIPDAPGEIPFE
ncbi:MAG: hypothetical protein AAGJ32_07990 [Pseudomonadota bacterium]